VSRTVVIAGGGAAGAAAALAAAAAGARVRLVRRALGATALSSGAVDLAGQDCELAGDPWAGRPSSVTLLEAQQRRERRHPLALAGVDHSLASDILRRLCATVPLLAFRSLDLSPLVLPTDLGTFKSTTLAAHPAVRGDLSGLAGGRIGVVGFRGYPGHDAAMLAAGYARIASRGAVDLETAPVAVDLFRMRDERLAHPNEVAQMLDQEAAQGRLADQLARIVKAEGLTHLLLPPVLGLEEPTTVVDRLTQETGAAVCETLATPPISVPGLRLQRALDAAMQGAEVGLQQTAAAGPVVEGDRLCGLELKDGDTLTGDAFVLATGKFIGGGLVHREGALTEPLLRLPVWIDEDGPNPRHLGRHLARQVQGPHPLFCAGVRVDGSLRPVNRRGGPVWDNLYAAGSVIGGYDYLTGRSGLGTALITGWIAGTHAAQGGADNCSPVGRVGGADK